MYLARKHKTRVRTHGTAAQKRRHVDLLVGRLVCLVGWFVWLAVWLDSRLIGWFVWLLVGWLLLTGWFACLFGWLNSRLIGSGFGCLVVGVVWCGVVWCGVGVVWRRHAQIGRHDGGGPQDNLADRLNLR
jgi:hypothetical protein